MKHQLYAIILVFAVIQLSAQDCYNNFTYYRPITLSVSPEQGTIAAASIAIPIDTKTLYDAGKLKADGSDLRVTDSECNELAFYIQGIADRDMNVLYVSVPEITTAGFEVQLYYGDEGNSASQINGEAVFDFFDDFEDGVIDTDKWEAVGAYSLWEETGGAMRFTGTSGGSIFKFVRPTIGYAGPTTMDFVANANNGQIYGVADTADIQRIALRYKTGAQSFDTLDIIAMMFDTITGGTNPGVDYPLVQVVRNDLNIISISSFIDDDNYLNFTRFTNYSSGSQNLDTLTVSAFEYEVQTPFFASFSGPIIMEYVGIRPTPEANHLIEYGSESLLNPMSAIDRQGQLKVSLFPNPASTQVQVAIPELHHRDMVIFVRNMSGQLMLKQQADSMQRLDVSNWSQGQYLLIIEDEGGREVYRQLFSKS